MKKILSLAVLFLTLGTNHLIAFRVYNHSNTEEAKKMGLKKANTTIMVYKNMGTLGFGVPQGTYPLKPGESKGWNWKEIDKKNRKKIWYWVSPNVHLAKFPIGGAIVFWGKDKNNKEHYQVYFDEKPWGKPISF